MIRASRSRGGRPTSADAAAQEAEGEAAAETADTGASGAAAGGAAGGAAGSGTAGDATLSEEAASTSSGSTGGATPAADQAGTAAANQPGTAAANQAATPAADQAATPAADQAAAPAADQAAAPAADQAAAPAADQAGTAAGPARPAVGPGNAGGRRLRNHLLLLLAFEVAGIAATWPRITYLTGGKLPANRDAVEYVWDFWWVAHQLVHLGNPFYTTYMAAPVGAQLGYDTLLPLPAWLLSPITVLYGPSASYTLLSIITPGLLCYVMYRAARLWLNNPGAIAAGAFFGLSSMLAWQNWYHVNIAVGSIFLPLTVEAAVRLRRKPGMRPAVGLGLALGASILVNQESTVVAIFLAAAILIPWIAGKLIRDRAALRPAVWPLAVGGIIAVAIASPELIAMFAQLRSGGASPEPGLLAQNLTQYGSSLPTLFAPSPRLADFGLGGLASSYRYSEPTEAVATFGIVLTLLAVLGLVAGWRKKSTWWFAALWLACGALALGPTLIVGGSCRYSQLHPGVEYGRYCHQYFPLLTHLHGLLYHGSWQRVPVSNLMPYTWLIRIPGLAGMREADRFALVGLIGVAMLAGLAVQWLSRRRATIPLIAVVTALGVLEAGWAGTGGPGTMPTTMPRLDQRLLADHSNDVYVDVPFGLRGGLSLTGDPMAVPALLIATHDGHPRADGYVSWVPQNAVNGIGSHKFYLYLMNIVQAGSDPSTAQLRAARADLRTLNIGYVLEWRNLWKNHDPGLRLGHIDRYLVNLGFKRVRSVCLGRTRTSCPNRDQLWLYHQLARQ